MANDVIIVASNYKKINSCGKPNLSPFTLWYGGKPWPASWKIAPFWVGSRSLAENKKLRDVKPGGGQREGG